MIDFATVKEEIVVFLRNNITDLKSPSYRVRNITETFSGDGSTTSFTLQSDYNKDNIHVVKNVHSLTIGGVLQTPYTNYTAYYRGTNVGNIIFATAPDSGADNISVNYDRGRSWIYTDLNRASITPKKLPIITVEIISSPTDERGIGGQVNRSTIIVSTTVFASSTYDTDRLTKSMRDAILQNKKNFQNFGIITNPRLSPMIAVGDRKAFIFQRTVDWDILGEYEFPLA